MNITRLLPSDRLGFWVRFRRVKEDLSPMNPVYFLKMAHGDSGGLRDLAFDYFNDTRRLMTGWMSMIEAGKLRPLA